MINKKFPVLNNGYWKFKYQRNRMIHTQSPMFSYFTISSFWSFTTNKANFASLGGLVG